MRRNPLYVFSNINSIGIYDIPLGSTVHIVDVDGDGNPMFLELIGKVDLNPKSTIGDLLDTPYNYIDLTRLNEVYSELELIIEDDKIGWRILGRDPDNFGPNGVGSIDFSDSQRLSDHNGAIGDNSFAEGTNTSVFGRNAHVSGLETIAAGLNQFVLGQWNKNSVFNIFEVGIGTGVPGIDERKNAFEIDKEGRLLAPSLDLDLIDNDNSLITKEYFSLYGSTGELVKITEGPVSDQNTGWRLKGETPDKHGIIGKNALDFVISTMTGSDVGATGDNSFAAGLNTICRNDYGTAFGRYNVGTDANTILEIGNGAGTALDVRSNALEVYKDGEVVAPSMTPDMIKNGSERILVTKEYLTDARVCITSSDIDITNPAFRVYGVSVDSSVEKDSVEVFVNGILLRQNEEAAPPITPKKYQYGVKITTIGIEVEFNDSYTLHKGDWLRIKIPYIKMQSCV